MRKGVKRTIAGGTEKSIEAAKQQGIIEKATFNGNGTFRECQLNASRVTFLDKQSCIWTQTTSNVSLNGKFIELKETIWDEITKLKWNNEFDYHTSRCNLNSHAEKLQ